MRYIMFKGFHQAHLQWCCAALLCVLSVGLSAQTTRLAGVRLHQGYVLIHSKDLVPVKNSWPVGVELDYAWHRLSERAWASCNCYPRVGVSMTVWDYDDAILGQGLTGLLYLEPVFGARNRLSFSVRAGFGLSYQNRPYDPLTNPFNLSYSTYVAFPLQLGGNMHYRLTPRWYVDGTLVYNHFSNGGIKDPNKGINWPSMAIGVARYFEPPVFEDRVKKNWKDVSPPERWLEVMPFLAFQEPRSKLYLFSPGVEVRYNYQVSRINAITGSLEYIHDNTDVFFADQLGREPNPHKAGLAVGHAFLLGKTVFGQQFGFYLYNRGVQPADVYQRYSLMYRFHPRFSAGISLKAHGHVADFLDFRFAYTLLSY